MKAPALLLLAFLALPVTSAHAVTSLQPAQQPVQPVGQPAGQPGQWRQLGQQPQPEQSQPEQSQSVQPQSVQPQSVQPQLEQPHIQPAQPLVHAQAGSGAPTMTPNIPLGNLEESNAGLTLGTSLPKGSTWQLNSFPSPQGDHPQQVYKLSPSAALTVYFDPARRRAIKISMEVVHVPAIYGPQAKSIFENEVLMAVRFGGNLFMEMERNPQLVKAMEDRLSLHNASLLEGKIIDFGMTEMPIVYSARLEGGRYRLDIMGK